MFNLFKGLNQTIELKIQKMKNLFIVTILSLIFSFQAFSQSANIAFEKSLHDFGTIKEIDGEQFYQFKFKNSGKAPLVIQNVKASCGCTTPEWTKAPIAAGKDGFIKVSFDPKNRPGPFSKSITVTSNSTPNQKVLTIKGKVIERVKTMDDKYKYTMGGLKLKSNQLAMTKIKNTEKKTEELVLLNPTDKTISVEFDRIPKFIQLDKIKFSVKPKEEIIVKVTYDAAKKNDLGFVSDKIMAIVNNSRDPKNNIKISANIKQDFSKLTPAELSQAPKIMFESKMFNFGELKEGDSKSYQFKFKNTGKTDLNIKKIKTVCGCTVTEAKSDIIKPGASSTIDVTFNSKGKSGKQMKTITIFTNDPTNSSQILRVKGNVNKG